MTTVDVHTHVMPESVLRSVSRPQSLFGVRYEAGALTYRSGITAPVTADFLDPDSIIKRMDRAEIGVSILSLSPTMFFYSLPEYEAVNFAQLANDAVADMASASDRLEGFAHIPMQSPRAAAAELRRCVLQLGMRGALIGTDVESAWLDEPEFAVVLDAAQQLGVPLSLHPYFDGPKARLEPYYLTNSIGNPLETSIAAARLVHAGTLDRFPRLKLILAHGGGFLPYQLGRMDHAWSVRPEPRRTITRPPSAYSRRFWFDTLTHGHKALELLASTVGPDRLVVGTDLPFDMGDGQPLHHIRKAGLDPDQLGETATKLVDLPRTSSA